LGGGRALWLGHEVKGTRKRRAKKRPYPKRKKSSFPTSTKRGSGEDLKKKST